MCRRGGAASVHRCRCLLAHSSWASRCLRRNLRTSPRNSGACAHAVSHWRPWPYQLRADVERDRPPHCCLLASIIAGHLGADLASSFLLFRTPSLAHSLRNHFLHFIVAHRSGRFQLLGGIFRVSSVWRPCSGMLLQLLSSACRDSRMLHLLRKAPCSLRSTAQTRGRTERTMQRPHPRRRVVGGPITD